jgi:hypothetical protein
MKPVQTRRRFLTTLSVPGATGSLRFPSVMAGEEALETTTVRLVADYSICSPRLALGGAVGGGGLYYVRFVERAVDRAPPGSRAPQPISV